MVESVESAESEESSSPNGERSVTELLQQLGRDLGVLALCEAQLTASRHELALRRTARDSLAVLGAGLALVAAFALANAAAVIVLSTALPAWVAALVLAAAWCAIGVILLAGPSARARRLLRLVPDGAERARDEAQQAVRDTLDELVPALATAVAAAAVPVATDLADELIDAGEDVIDEVDDYVEEAVENVPGGGIVAQAWDVVLLPGRLGVRVAATVLRLGDEPGTDSSPERSGSSPGSRSTS